MLEQLVNTGSQAQMRGVPEVFGQNPISQLGQQSFETVLHSQELGVLVYLECMILHLFLWMCLLSLEKWTGNPPLPNTSSWTTREGEILGWNSYINDLTAWSMQASLELGHEIQQACKWHEPIQWLSMKCTAKVTFHETYGYPQKFPRWAC